MGIRSIGLVLALTLACPAITPAQEKARFADLQQALRTSATLSGQVGPRNVTWIQGGRRLSFITTDQSGADEIRVYDPVTGVDTLVFTARGLTFPKSRDPFEYQSFQWSGESKHLLFQTRYQQVYRRSGVADYYVHRLADGSLTLAAPGARSAELSPDGRMLGYVRDGDLFVQDLADGRERRLTRGASATVFNGHFDWEYENEFGLGQAWKWSLDSRFLAYWQTDESTVPVMQFSNFEGRHPEWLTIRIPKPGDPTAKVRIGVIDVRDGHNVWLKTEADEYYVPRIYWVNRPDTLAIMTLNREQNELKLFFYDVQNGGRRLVMAERSHAWVDVFDFFEPVTDMIAFPVGTDQFFWISDRDGWQHIYRYDYAGTPVSQVTRGRWSVARIEGIDAKAQTIYYTSTEESPLQRHLYSIRFDGTEARRITQAQGTHAIGLSPDTRYYIDRWSSINQPPQMELWATSGKKVRTFVNNAQVTQWLATHPYSPAELFSFTTSDSMRLDASMVKPVPFDSTRQYPVVLAIYGGTGAQQVFDAFGTAGWNQWLAQQGYIVVGVNNRGSNNYGSAFMKVAYKRGGYWQAHDFAETARYLRTLSFVDGKRIAIMGGSYGGFNTILSMELYPDIFTVGIANSAVTDWRLYDAVCTERYMGLLDEAVYDSVSAIKHVGRLKGRLLMIHSMMDDNVHPQHTMQFLTAATNAGVDVDVRIYPLGRHGSSYNETSALLIRQVSYEYLERYLKGPTSAD